MKIVILGAGFAGLTLAWHLVKTGVEGKNVTLIDRARPGSGASGVPGAMMHPVPGRSLAPKPAYLDCYFYSKDWLQKLSQQTQSPFIKPIKLWRGAFDSKTAQRFQRSFEKAQLEPAYPSLVKQIPLDQVSYLGHFEALYEVFPAFHIQPNLLLKELVSQLQHAGVNCLFEISICPEFTKKGNSWHVQLNTQQLECKHLILSVANGLLEYFPQLPLEIVRGEALLLEHPRFNDLEHAISSRGYITPIGGNRALAGTSFFPSHIAYDKQRSIQEIMEKIKKIIPFSETAEIVDIWSGQRTILPPHREPLVGKIPNTEGLYILSAFATKGWLQIPYSALQLARLITSQPSQIPDNFQSNRLPPSLFT